MSVFSDMEELVRIGAYARGADAEVDEAVRLQPALEAFLMQATSDRQAPEDAFASLQAILDGAPPEAIAANQTVRLVAH